MGATMQLFGLHQVLEGEHAQRFLGRIAKQAFGTGIEGADHTLEAGGDDRHLGRGIEHTAQLVVGFAQRLLADAQLGVRWATRSGRAGAG
jgi:hypothetical protein